MKSMRLILFVLGLTLACSPAWAATRRVSEVGSHVLTTTFEEQGPKKAYVTAQMEIPARAEQIWAVLTDYDSLERFMPCLQESEVISRAPSMVTVRQEGGIWLPFFKCQTKATIWIHEQQDQSIHFQAIEGDFHQYEGSWRLEPAGEKTNLIYEAVIEPKFWVPKWAFIELEHRIMKGTFEAVAKLSAQSPIGPMRLAQGKTRFTARLTPSSL